MLLQVNFLLFLLYLINKWMNNNKWSYLTMQLNIKAVFWARKFWANSHQKSRRRKKIEQKDKSAIP